MAVSFGPFAVGLGKGYTSPALASLLPQNNTDEPRIDTFSPHLPNLTITEQQGSWIASLSLLGALFGGLFSGLIFKYGRRKTLIFVSIPLSVSWIFTLFAYCVEMIYATAFIAGFCSAIVQVSLVLFTNLRRARARSDLAGKLFSRARARLINYLNKSVKPIYQSF